MADGLCTCGCSNDVALLDSGRCSLLNRVQMGGAPLREVKIECCDGVLIAMQAHQMMCTPDVHQWFEMAVQNNLHAALSEISDRSVKYVREMLSKCVWSKELTPEIKSFTKHIRKISPQIESTIFMKWDGYPVVLTELEQLKRSVFATVARATEDLIPRSRFCYVTDNGLMVSPVDVEAAYEAIDSVFTI